MSFPGLERCDHGEYLDRYCVKCDLEAKAAEIKRLQDRNDFLAQQVVDLGHEVTRLKADNSLLLMCPGEAEYDVRDMMEPCEPPDLSDFPSE